MSLGPLPSIASTQAAPWGAASASAAVERRSFQAAATARQEGRLFAYHVVIEQVGPAGAQASLKQGLIRDFSARATAKRLAALALRKFLAGGVPPSRAALEQLFAQTQAAVEKGVRLALRLLRSQGAGAEALGGAAEAGVELQEALARWRAGEPARPGG